MRTRMFSPFLLLAGLIVGLLAMWAGASPLGTTGDLITGGWVECGFGGASPYWATPNGESCDQCGDRKCSGSYSSTCSSYDGPGYCSGGSITVVICASGGDQTISFSGMVACYCEDHLGEFTVKNTTCY